MNKKPTTGIQRGQAITFRLPSDTPDHLVKQLQKLKETERRNFSSKMAEFVLEGVNHSLVKEKETITIPIPKQLTKEQRNWLKHSHSEALLGSIVYQLLADPIRATTLLASLTSHSLDINEALYLQEEEETRLPSEKDDEDTKVEDHQPEQIEDTEIPVDDIEDDLMDFNWEKALKEISSSSDENPTSKSIEEEDDLLGDFLSQMNK